MDQGQIRMPLSDINNSVDHLDKAGTILVVCSHILPRYYAQVYYVLCKQNSNELKQQHYNGKNRRSVQHSLKEADQNA